MIEDKNNKNFFKFEREGLDFPFYNDIPKLSSVKWIILAIAFVITIFMHFIPMPENTPYIVKLFLSLFLLFLAFLYVSKGKLGLICKKFQKSDFKFLIIIFIIEVIFSFALLFLLNALQGTGAEANPVFDKLHTLRFWIVFPLQIFNEELIKVIGFILVLFLVTKLTNNRKMAIIIATAISLTIFGLMHYPSYKNILHSIVAIGFGSIVTMFAYLKTKNILASYIVHLCYDLFMFSIALVGT